MLMDFDAARASCCAAQFDNGSGPALQADGVWVEGSVLLKDYKPHPREEGHSEQNSVSLRGALVGGLECDGAILRSHAGPALNADCIHVNGHVFIRKGFEAEGSGNDGTVNLNEGNITGPLDCSSFTLINRTGGLVLNASDLRVGGTLTLEDPGGEANLAGLTYAGTPDGMNRKDWRGRLRDKDKTPKYSAQPYQQLAEAYQTAGREVDAREILLARGDDEIDRKGEIGLSGWALRWQKITNVAGKYGYKPHRLLWYSLIPIAVLCIIPSVSIFWEGAAYASSSKSCGTLAEIAVGLNYALPLFENSVQNGCSVHPGFQVLGRILGVAIWALGVFFILSLTSIVRKR
ncbi:hypothetical protein [Streptomyces coffeae]|uniref:Oxidoreductase n=1 Tax=Streptomyces coffeae TaxID=621382 RepID=A0ABS1NNQ2_9ACTN|nr:hypothetical protein [Streptomyces coffeae]MBL1101719.1 hypothetical protein [Streptomyces coffeae]